MQISSEREAGFYTTRYGKRGDPMMRFKETQTRYFPEPMPAIPESTIHLVGPDLVEKAGETSFIHYHKPNLLLTIHFQTYLLL